MFSSRALQNQAVAGFGPWTIVCGPLVRTDWRRVSEDMGSGTRLSDGPGQAAWMWVVMEGHVGVKLIGLSDETARGVWEGGVSR